MNESVKYKSLSCIDQQVCQFREAVWIFLSGQGPKAVCPVIKLHIGVVDPTWLETVELYYTWLMPALSCLYYCYYYYIILQGQFHSKSWTYVECEYDACKKQALAKFELSCLRFLFNSLQYKIIYCRRAHGSQANEIGGSEWCSRGIKSDTLCFSYPTSCCPHHIWLQSELYEWCCRGELLFQRIFKHSGIVFLATFKLLTFQSDSSSIACCKQKVTLLWEAS